MQAIDSVDLFAGGGGTSTGLVLAAKEASMSVNLVAINHDRKALATHEANYPWATHLLTEVQAVKPSEAVPEGRLDILVASPECIYHSRALGGRPKNDQSRSSAWYLERWIRDLDVNSLLVENVPEFVNWGPLDANDMPIKERQGTIFRLWLYKFRKYGYNVDYRVLNSADFGDATTRKRLFVIARKGDAPITWPDPTFGRKGTNGLKKWRGAREIIDWSIQGQSIFNRKKPLSPNTVRRIIAGMKKFSGPEFRPFLVLLEHSSLKPEYQVKDIDSPVPTITGARGGAIAVARHFLLPVEGFYRQNKAKDVSDPVGTITQRGYGALTEYFIYQANHNSKGSSLDDPLPAETTNNKLGKIDAFVTSYHGGNPNRNTPVEQPVGTFGTSNTLALAEPYIVSYYGKGDATSVKEPIPTATTKDRFALVQPEIIIDGTTYKLEILYRMLKPHELAAAMGFPDDYVFVGNRTQVVKQIGNAVAVNTARALASSLISRDMAKPTLMEAAT